MPEPSETVFLHHLADRLIWSLLQAPSTVQVLDMDENNDPHWFPLLTEPHHPVAVEPITEPPRSRMLVVLDLVEYADYFQDSGDEPPAPLVIENLDGQPISVAQFITKVHEYTLRLRDQIYELEDRADNEEAIFFFSWASGPLRTDAFDTNARFAVNMRSNIIPNDNMLEEICAIKVRRFVEQQYFISGRSFSLMRCD
jgi:hypothetical protein